VKKDGRGSGTRVVLDNWPPVGIDGEQAKSNNISDQCTSHPNAVICRVDVHSKVRRKGSEFIISGGVSQAFTAHLLF